LKAGNPSSVLGLMGLHNILEKQLMPHTFIEYLKAPQIPPTGGLSNPPKDALGQLISSTIADLI